MSGNCDHTLQMCLTAKELLTLYSMPILRWRPSSSELPRIVESSTLRFCQKQNTVTAEAIKGLNLSDKDIAHKKQMRKEEALLAQIWVERQQEQFHELHKKINGSKHNYSLNYPTLARMINEVSHLHVQGCRRFFYALTWREFETARRFFETFMKKLEIEFDLLESTHYSPEQLTGNVIMLYESMKVFVAAMSSIFTERMMLDMSMRKNTRTGVYATGAYESVLRQYREWIRNLRNLLKNITGSKASMEFLLIPMASGAIETRHLFPLSVNNAELVIFYSTFDGLLDPQNALAIFAHETGHYAGIVERELRVNTYLIMISTLFARHVARILSLRDHIPVPMIALEPCINRLANSLATFYMEKLRFLQNSHCSSHLGHVEAQCEVWFSDLVIDLKELFNNPSTHTLKDGHEEIAKAIFDMYDMLNITHAISDADNGFFFATLALASNAGMNVKTMRIVIRETYSDMIQICVLSLNAKSFFEMYLKWLDVRDKATLDGSSEKGDAYNINVDVMRAVSAIMVIVSRDQKFTIADFDKMLSLLPDAVTNQAKEISKIATPSAQRLSAAMLEFASATETQDSNSRITWRYLATYIYEAGYKVSMLLQTDEAKKLTDNLRSLYDDISRKSGWEQLHALLEWKGDA